MMNDVMCSAYFISLRGIDQVTSLWVINQKSNAKSVIDPGLWTSYYLLFHQS